MGHPLGYNGTTPYMKMLSKLKSNFKDKVSLLVPVRIMDN